MLLLLLCVCPSFWVALLNQLEFLVPFYLLHETLIVFECYLLLSFWTLFILLALEIFEDLCVTVLSLDSLSDFLSLEGHLLFGFIPQIKA